MEQVNILIEQYGYLGIFIALIAGIVGLPLPDELLLTFVGYNVFAGRMSWILAILISILGSIIGITISFILGKALGLPFLKRYGSKVHITEKRIESTQYYFSKYGNWFLMFGYFIPGVRHITAYIAGICNYSFKQFSIFAYLGAIIWINTFITLGIILGKNWKNIFEYIPIILLITLPLVVIGIIIHLKKRN